MGRYIKVYLTGLESDALEVLQAKREKEGGVTAVNAIMKDALREVMAEEGIAEWRTVGRSTGLVYNEEVRHKHTKDLVDDDGRKLRRTRGARGPA